MIYVQLFCLAAVIMAGLDTLWLGLAARKLYRRQLGDRLRARPQWAVAAAVYALYAAGLVYFVLSWSVTLGEAILNGAFFGLVVYGLYNLTNAASLRDWPWLLVLVDVTWGAVLTGLVSGATFALIDFL